MTNKTRLFNGYYGEQTRDDKMYCYRVVDGIEVSHIVVKHYLVGRILLMIGAIFQ